MVNKTYLLDLLLPATICPLPCQSSARTADSKHTMRFVIYQMHLTAFTKEEALAWEGCGTFLFAKLTAV